MPKDYLYMDESTQEHSPVGGLSDAIYTEMTLFCQPKEWTESPIGGLSFPEFLRIAELVE
jgi:hypothetical protein